MTRDYRKLFERVFNEVNSISEMFLRFDLYHINYDPSNKFALTKYVYKLFRTFKHSKDLDASWMKWLNDNIDDIASVEKIHFWIENELLRNRGNSPLNTKLVKLWIKKHRIKGLLSLSRNKKYNKSINV